MRWGVFVAEMPFERGFCCGVYATKAEAEKKSKDVVRLNPGAAVYITRM